MYCYSDLVKILEKVSINKHLIWFWEGMRWRWKRFWNRSCIFLKSKFIDLLSVLHWSHQYQIYLEHGVRFYVYRKQVNRSQWYSEKEFRFYQNNSLKKIILHSYENVPYYRKLFDSHGIHINDIEGIDQLSRIPILEKESVKTNPVDFLASNIWKHKYIKFRTSGSTGKPLEIFVDRKLNTLALCLTWRDYNSLGYTFDKRSVLITHPLGFSEGKINRKDLWKFHKLSNVLDINTAMLEGENIMKICKKIDEFNPEYIITYPSFAYTLSLYLENHRTINIKPKAIFTGSEKLYPEQRELIEQFFGCKVYDFYGMWEHLMFASACSHGNLHTNPELGILEIIKNGKRCEKGETGELVCTTLHNYSMPLLRYAMGDYGYIEDIECPCGRKSEILSIVGCRDRDLIVTKNGFINVMSGTLWFGQKSRIKQIQFYQEKKGEVIVRLVPDEDFNNTDLNNLKESLNNYFNDSVDLSFEFVNKIPRTEAGKYKYVESKVPIEF